MRKHFKKVLFLSILVAILLLMNFWMDREWAPHFPLQYGEVFHPRVKADVIILGASHATHGINPKYLEADHLKVYNFSLNGAGPSFYLKWYRKVFQHYYQKPVSVIYAVHWVMFDEKLLKRRFEQDSQYFPLHFLQGELKDLETLRGLLLNRVAFIRERKRLPVRLLGRLFSKKRDRDMFPLSRYYNGFIPLERRGGFGKKDIIHLQNSKAQIDAFEALLDELERQQIKVIFVHVPGYLPGREAPNLPEAAKILNKIAEKRKIPFFDYESERVTAINTDSTLFADWAHLNEKGSDAFSKLLSRDLDGLLK